MQQYDHRHADDAGNRRDAANKVEIEFLVERGVDRIRYGGKQKRVSVRGRVHDGLGADVAASSRPVLDDEGLPQPIGKPLTDQPRGDVDAAAGGKTGDNAHRPRRIIVRQCELRKGGSGDNAAGEFKEFTAEKFHIAPLWQQSYPNSHDPSRGGQLLARRAS